MTVWRRYGLSRMLSFFLDKLSIPTQQVNDIAAEHRDFAFSVAGIMSVQALSTIHEAIADQMRDGVLYRDFLNRFEAIAQSIGFMPKGGVAYRGYLIVDTNLRQTYRASRHEQMSKLASRRPYWMWRHRDSKAPRELHLGWNGLILPADDPFWKSCFPPCGYNCKCTVFSLSEEEAQKQGIGDSPELSYKTYVKPDGTRVRIPTAVDPGFEAVPRNRQELASQRQEAIAHMLSQLPPHFRSAYNNYQQT